jgi:hypothetical protein
MEKLRRFAIIQRYIGFDWNLSRRTVSLPPEKRKVVIALLDEWLAPVAQFSSREAARLHGKLVYVASIYPLIRPFLPSAATFSRAFQSERARLHPPDRLRADLEWVRQLLDILPRELPLASPKPVDIGWWGDASTSFGIGVVVGGRWAVWSYHPGFTVGPGQTHDIGWAEAVAVELGLLIAVQYGAVRGEVARRYLVRSDNQGVVAVLNKGRSRSEQTNEVLKRVYTLLAQKGISLHAEYVASRDNVTDALSRGDIAEFLRGFPDAVERAALELPVPLQTLLDTY